MSEAKEAIILEDESDHEGDDTEELELHPSKSFRENRCLSHKYSFLNMIGAKLSDQRNAGRFKPTNQRLASHGFPAGSQKTAESQALIGRFETACIP